MAPLDTDRIQQALRLAEQAIGCTEPNPRVGCVIGTETGAVLGLGATQHAGGRHAEAMALADAAAAGHNVRGATAWVTLEPCAHQGRTPPCCDALIASGIKRVVVCLRDPFAQVAGAGLGRLRAAGVQVEWSDLASAQAALDLNIGFFSRVLRQRPWVRVKVAMSLDGRTALPNGHSQWITGPEARADGHAWRKRASAVLTGVGTVLADDPDLTVRLVPSTWQPLRVVVDSQLRTPPTARLFQNPSPVLLAMGATPNPAALAQLQNLVGRECLSLPQRAANTAGAQVDLPRLMHTLAQRGVNEVHVEAGATLNGSLADAGLVDEWLLYLAPKLLGSGPGPLHSAAALTHVDQATPLALVDNQVVGNDLRLRLRLQKTSKSMACAANHRPDL